MECEASCVGGSECGVPRGPNIAFAFEDVRAMRQVLALPGERIAPASRITVPDCRDRGEYLTRTHADDLADAECPVEREVHVAVLELRARRLTSQHLVSFTHRYLRYGGIARFDVGLESTRSPEAMRNGGDRSAAARECRRW